MHTSVILILAGAMVLGLCAGVAMAAGESGPAVDKPRVTCDRWPSNYDAKSWAADVWRIEKAQTDEEKTIALLKWVRLQFHWGDQCADGTRGRQPSTECDAIKKINIYTYGECSDFGVTAAALGTAGGLKAMEAHVPGHTELEVFYKDADGVERWHRVDPFWGFIVYDKSGKHIATSEEIKADPDVALKPSKFVEPWGDKKSDRQRFAEKAAFKSDNRVRPSLYTMDKPLYAGESYTLSWERDASVGYYNAHPSSKDKQELWGFIRFGYAGGDPDKLAYGHELLRPYIHKDKFRGEDQLMVYQAHGSLEFKPLVGKDFADSLYQPAVNVAAADDGPKLRPAKAGAPAELVYLAQTPYVIADAAMSGAFRAGPEDSVKVSMAYADWREKGYTLDQVVPAKPQWRQVWKSAGKGEEKMELKLSDLDVRGEYKLLLKVELSGADAAKVGMDELSFSCKFQEGPLALPRLLPGKNAISVAAGELRPGYKLGVTYCWDDAKGKDQKLAKTIDAAPAQFVIETAGQKPADVKTNWLRLEAVK